MKDSTNIRLTTLVSQLQLLERAYVNSGISSSGDSSADPRTATSRVAIGLLPLIQYVQALLRNVVGSTSFPARRHHVAVFGGTQVGKSTVINLLAGSHSARVYHTAGFTRHAQAFVADGHDCQNVLAGFSGAFPGFQCVGIEELSLDRPQEFAVSLLNGPSQIPQTVFWDTPDCDAVDAHRYRIGMLEAITVADVVVYVTSREKYAVNAILEWLLVLLQSGTPVVACLNMTPEEQQPELKTAMAEALHKVTERQGAAAHSVTEPLAPIAALPFLNRTELAALVDSTDETIPKLRESVQNKFSEDRDQRRAQALEFMEQIADYLVQPAIDQLQARASWNASVDAALETFVSDYRSSYLDNPHRYDAFNRVGLEILALMDPPIPGLRKALFVVRTVLSLPARAIIYGSRAVWRYFSSGGASMRKQPVVPNEIVTFHGANDRLLNSLAGLPQQRRTSGGVQPFWEALASGWAQTMPTIQKDFKTKLEQHRLRTEEWVRETAQGIYQELARDPVKLNLLRSGRIAADAGAIIISIHTGGHGNVLHDILVTPAMMALVQAISQQLASSYVEQKRRELRERLLADTRIFAEDVYGSPLRKLGQSALQEAGFGGMELQELTKLGERFRELRNAGRAGVM
ncbi:MAG: GTPase domain-containing protein [Candidatus Sumerlaeaceae bacterium]